MKFLKNLQSSLFSSRLLLCFCLIDHSPSYSDNLKSTFRNIESSSLLESFVRTNMRDADSLKLELSNLKSLILKDGSSMSLQECIKTALRNNEDLASAYYKIQSDEWNLIQEKRKFIPTLAINSGSSLFEHSWNTSIINIYGKKLMKSNNLSLIPNTRLQKNSNSTVAPGISLNWNFIDPVRSANIHSLTYSLDSQKYLFDIVIRSIILDVQTSYLRIQALNQLIISYNELYSLSKQQLDTIEAQSNIEFATVLDVEQVRSQLFDQFTQLIAYTQEFIDEAATLSELLSLPNNKIIIPEDSLDTPNEWAYSLDESIKIAIDNREEIKSLMADTKSSKWASIALLRSYLPSFNLVANAGIISRYGASGIDYNENLNDYLTQTTNFNGSIGLSFQWTLFDGGVSSAGANSFRATSNSQKKNALQARNNVVQEIRSSFSEYKTSKLAFQSSLQSYSSALKSKSAAYERFIVGIGDITSLIQTMNQLSAASRQATQSLLALNLSFVELYRNTAIYPSGIPSNISDRKLGLGASFK